MGHPSDVEVVQPGSYVIIEKQGFRKLVKLTEKGTFTLGKEQVEMEQLVGKPYWTTFKMTRSKNNKKIIALEVTDRAETLEDIRQGLASGQDNRTITDDGTSQKLSKEQIEDLRDAGKSGKEIVTSLIVNSSSFAAKTEFSQEKYIKKKEKKYFRHLTIKKPTISLVQEIYFRQDPPKINYLRMDSLSQILSYADVRSEGNFLLYDSGTCGLVAAAALSRIGAQNQGTLLHFHPGIHAQTTLVQGMNFPAEQLDRVITVNLFTFYRIWKGGEENELRKLVKKHIEWKKLKESEAENPPAKRQKIKHETEQNYETKSNIVDGELQNVVLKTEPTEENETKANIVDETIKNITVKIEENGSNGICDIPDTFKEPKWFSDTKAAINFVKTKKLDGAMIVAKENPINILPLLFSFLGVSRPFVIYHCYREPLEEIYMMLKNRKMAVNLKLFTSFLRGYQVLPNRTHPDIMTNDLGGYLLTGFLVEP